MKKSLLKLTVLSVMAAFTLAPASFAAEQPNVSQTQQVQLPKVAILATGGTIASRGSGALSLTDYGVGSGHKPVGIEVLVDAVPEIKNFAQISGEQVFNVGSSKLSIENWLTLANRINDLLATKDVDGIVVTAIEDSESASEICRQSSVPPPASAPRSITERSSPRGDFSAFRDPGWESVRTCRNR